ncbi:MAG: hypothetical protein U1E26_12405 [Coriobacteriia bacterium]|nr:hypothetical protein [Coriobacteriia bacterium]
MLAEAVSMVQIGHLSLFVAGLACLFWAGPVFVASCGTRQTLRTLRPRQVWDYQRGYAALVRGTRVLMVASALAVFVWVVF